MVRAKSEAWEIASLNDLLDIARAMEQEAIDGYLALEKRMLEMGHSDLSAVFRILVIEEQGHLGKVEEWRGSLGRNDSLPSSTVTAEHFDDEGASLVAPELLTAYRAFSTAVRNEERAFVFWSYVSAHANSEEIRKAAERMAREELGHVAKLRRERRKAFHDRTEAAATAKAADPETLERRLAQSLELLAADPATEEGKCLASLADAATLRANSLRAQPFASGLRPLERFTETPDKVRPLSEFLLDFYLDHAERIVAGQEAERARSFAAQLIACVRALRVLG